MKYEVIKKFYDPFLQRRVMPGESIEVKNKHIEGYKGYIEIPGAPKEKAIEEKRVTIEEAMAAPAMKITERPKKKDKGKK